MGEGKEQSYKKTSTNSFLYKLIYNCLNLSNGICRRNATTTAVRDTFSSRLFFPNFRFFSPRPVWLLVFFFLFVCCCLYIHGDERPMSRALTSILRMSSTSRRPSTCIQHLKTEIPSSTVQIRSIITKKNGIGSRDNDTNNNKNNKYSILCSCVYKNAARFSTFVITSLSRRDRYIHQIASHGLTIMCRRNFRGHGNPRTSCRHPVSVILS